jgi:hypothetical protein
MISSGTDQYLFEIFLGLKSRASMLKTPGPINRITNEMTASVQGKDAPGPFLAKKGSETIVATSMLIQTAKAAGRVNNPRINKNPPINSV